MIFGEVQLPVLVNVTPEELEKTQEIQVKPVANSSFVTVVLDTVLKTDVRYEKRQPRLDQAWFWTSEWQAREREADEDLAAGRYDDFETIDDFIENLETLMGEQ